MNEAVRVRIDQSQSNMKRIIDTIGQFLT